MLKWHIRLLIGIVATSIALAPDTMLGEALTAAPALATAAAPLSPNLNHIQQAGRVADKLSPERILRTLYTVEMTAASFLRGPNDPALFQTYASSIVLIVTPDFLGSGTLLDVNGTILTSASLVAGVKSVGVIFKKHGEGDRPREADASIAQVIRIDQIADLALVKVAARPSRALSVLPSDRQTIQPGTSLLAIGHPYGEIWSYASGVVANFRPSAQWTDRLGIRHQAQVVEVKMKARIGDMGAALIDERGSLIGITTASKDGLRGHNLAIAAGEVKRFLSSSQSRLQPVSRPPATTCLVKQLAARRSKRNDATVHLLDTGCNGRSDASMVVPDDKTKPVLLLVDANENGKNEAVYADATRDGMFDSVKFDVDEDGSVDLEGFGLNDNLEPARIELVRR